MNVTFYIRKQKGKFITPYVMINIDHKRTKTGFSSEIKILQSEWNEKTKTIKNYQRNLELQALKDRLYQIYNAHQFSGKYITCEELKAIFVAERRTKYLPEQKLEIKISDLLNAFLENRKKAYESDFLAKNTFLLYKTTVLYWLDFFEKQQIKPLELNKTHLEAFLASNNKISSKKTYLQVLKQVYGFAKSEKIISNFEFPKYDTKKVFFDNKPLEKKELEVILECRGLRVEERDSILNASLDLFKIQIFTGLAWVDTQNFDCTKHVQQIKNQPFICIKRQKTQRKTERESVVPLFVETQEIMNRYGGNFPKIDYRIYNKHLKEISKLLKISNLVSHKARKTATYYLTTIKGYARDLVRIMLGHSSDAMGDQHYFDAEKYLEGKL